jgi:hypothetical protein
VVVLGSFEKGLYVSRDNGATVTAVCDKGTCTATLFSQYSPGLALACVTDFSTGENRLYRSEDGAKTWSNEPQEFFVQQFLSEKGASRIWAAGDKGAFRSEDNGKTWSPRGLKGQEILCLAQHPSEPATLYAGGKDASLYKTCDAGETWEKLPHPIWPTGCEVHELAVHPADSKKLYVGLTGAQLTFAQRDVQHGGLWMSPDGGKSWVDLTGDLHNDHIHGDIVITPDGKSLLAGTYSGGTIRYGL